MGDVSSVNVAPTWDPQSQKNRDEMLKDAHGYLSKFLGCWLLHVENISTSNCKYLVFTGYSVTTWLSYRCQTTNMMLPSSTVSLIIRVEINFKKVVRFNLEIFLLSSLIQILERLKSLLSIVVNILGNFGSFGLPRFRNSNLWSSGYKW